MTGIGGGGVVGAVVAAVGPICGLQKAQKGEAVAGRAGHVLAVAVEGVCAARDGHEADDDSAHTPTDTHGHLIAQTPDQSTLLYI